MQNLVTLYVTYSNPYKDLRFPEVWGSHILRKSAQQVGMFVSHKHRPHLPPRNISLLLGAESTPEP